MTCPDIAALEAERPFLRCVLVRCGVASRDLDDVVQECLLGAWQAIRDGRYRPHSDDPAQALRRFLVGVAWRQASHWRARACVRCEILVAEPHALTGEPFADPAGALDAREALLAVFMLPCEAREALAFAAVGLSTMEIASALTLSHSGATGRLRRARRALARGLP